MINKKAVANWLLGGRFRVRKITKLENGQFVDYYGVKSRDLFLSDSNDQYKWLSPEQAEKKKIEIKKRYKEYDKS